MHPTTVIEIIVAAVFLMIISVIVLLLPKKFKKPGFIIVSLITVMLLSFFAIRPYWIDYQVSKKTEQLNQYLEEKYPGQKWKISRQVGRQYGPYDLNVEFKNETGWIYTYSTANEARICQSGWKIPEEERSAEGKHFEDDCEIVNKS